jgi:hypothetical protein
MEVIGHYHSSAAMGERAPYTNSLGPSRAHHIIIKDKTTPSSATVEVSILQFLTPLHVEVVKLQQSHWTELL